MVRPWVALVLCLAAGFLVYAPSLGGDLIWDDTYLVRENPFFRSPVFGLEVFRHYLFFDSFSTYYRPVQNWSYMLDYWLWHGDPLGYHCTNILIHSLSGFLLFLLLRQLLSALAGDATDFTHPNNSFAALLVALVWVVHPVHNAAVAYISGRADSLAALFSISAWLLMRKALASEGPGRKSVLGILAGVALLVGLCSKEIALVWLLLLLVHLFAFDRQQPWRAKWVVLAGATAVFVLYAILHALPGHRTPMEDGPPPPWDARVLLMLRALGDYTRLLFFPGQLYMERSISNPGIYASASAWRANAGYEYLSILGLLAILGAILGCARRSEGRGWCIFGAVWFLLAFLPISNLFPLNAEVAEHWIYLASIGFLIFVAGAILALPERGRRIAVGLVVLAILGLGARTAVRSDDWVDAETFCARTIASGGASPRILSTLASIYGQRGDYKKEEVLLRKMITQFPEYAPARISLGICLSRQGRNAEAESLLGATSAHAAEISRQYPRTWPAALQMAQLRSEAGHPEEALAIVREARSHFPDTWELIRAESQLLRGTAGVTTAIPLVEQYAATHWWHYDSQSTLGALRAEAGQPDAAISAFRAASRLDLYDGKALAHVASVESDRGHSDAALDAQAEAMSRDPDRPQHYVELASILEKMGRKSDADAALRRAQALVVTARRGS
jgi:tetratricopeptide (TPR) repeat protein